MVSKKEEKMGPSKTLKGERRGGPSSFFLSHASLELA